MKKLSCKQALISLCIALFTPTLCHAADRYLTIYHGKYSDERLGDVLLSKPIEYFDSYLGVIALSEVKPFKNPRHQWEIEAQVGKHYQGQTHGEFNVAAIYRINRPAWGKLHKTSVAIGDGLSYASETPPLELASHTNEGATQLLNYIVFEMTTAPYQAEDWSLVVRVHHRSGVFGIFDGVRGGSNVVAVGVKFRLH